MHRKSTFLRGTTLYVPEDLPDRMREAGLSDKEIADRFVPDRNGSIPSQSAIGGIRRGDSTRAGMVVIEGIEQILKRYSQVAGDKRTATTEATTNVNGPPPMADRDLAFSEVLDKEMEKTEKKHQDEISRHLYYKWVEKPKPPTTGERPDLWEAMINVATLLQDLTTQEKLLVFECALTCVSKLLDVTRHTSQEEI